MLVRKIVIGIKVSMTSELTLIISKTDNAKVIECPIVNAVTNINTFFQSFIWNNAQRLTTKSIWSYACRSAMWLKPIWKYNSKSDMIHLIFLNNTRVRKYSWHKYDINPTLIYFQDKFYVLYKYSLVLTTVKSHQQWSYNHTMKNT